jgi:hypothetical protein
MPGTIICLFIALCCFVAHNETAFTLWGWLGGAVYNADRVSDYFSYMAV